VIFEGGKEMLDQNELFKKAQGTATSYCALKLLAFIIAMLRKMFGTKTEEVTAGWIKLLNEILRNLYSPPNVIKVLKSSWTTWAAHVAVMGETRSAY
jgi:hypothetical protein